MSLRINCPACGCLRFIGLASSIPFARQELRGAREGQERLRSELETLRRRVEEEGTADAAGALRAQVLYGAWVSGVLVDCSVSKLFFCGALIPLSLPLAPARRVECMILSAGYLVSPPRSPSTYAALQC